MRLSEKCARFLTVPSFVNPISSHKARVLSVTNPYDSTIQSIHIEISINANVKLLMDDKMQWVYHLD